MISPGMPTVAAMSLQRLKLLSRLVRPKTLSEKEAGKGPTRNVVVGKRAVVRKKGVVGKRTKGRRGAVSKGGEVVRQTARRGWGAVPEGRESVAGLPIGDTIVPPNGNATPAGQSADPLLTSLDRQSARTIRQWNPARGEDEVVAWGDSL